MNVIENIQQKLGITEPSVESGGVHWLNPGTMNVRELAKTLLAMKARFITITAYQLPKEEGLRFEYHWDLDGTLLGFPYLLAGNSIDSLYDLTEAVDWIEREIHEGYAVDFIGRDYEPLLLREGDALGVNLREEVKK